MGSSLTECVFCQIATGKAPAVTVYEDGLAIAIMDLYPATPGHVLVFPKEHVADLYGMSPDLGASLFSVVVRLAKAMRTALTPAGLNVIQANGVQAGQTIAHFHFHLVPRYLLDDVELRFGHGQTAAEVAELEAPAARIKELLARSFRAETSESHQVRSRSGKTRPGCSS